MTAWLQASSRSQRSDSSSQSQHFVDQLETSWNVNDDKWLGPMETESPIKGTCLWNGATTLQEHWVTTDLIKKNKKQNKTTVNTFIFYYFPNQSHGLQKLSKLFNIIYKNLSCFNVTCSSKPTVPCGGENPSERKKENKKLDVFGHFFLKNYFKSIIIIVAILFFVDKVIVSALNLTNLNWIGWVEYVIQWVQMRPTNFCKIKC